MSGALAPPHLGRPRTRRAHAAAGVKASFPGLRSSSRRACGLEQLWILPHSIIISSWVSIFPYQVSFILLFLFTLLIPCGEEMSLGQWNVNRQEQAGAGKAPVHFHLLSCAFAAPLSAREFVPASSCIVEGTIFNIFVITYDGKESSAPSIRKSRNGEGSQDAFQIFCIWQR